MALHMGCWTEGVTPASTPILGLTVLLGAQFLATRSVEPGKKIPGGKSSDGAQAGEPHQAKGVLLLAFQLLRPFPSNGNQWPHNKMATLIVIFIAMITKLITVLLISFVHFLSALQGQSLGCP